MGKIHVLHENAEWVVPLEEALCEQGLPYELWFLDEGTVDFAAPPPKGVFYNRMSASSHTRGHRFAPELTHVVLNWLERSGRRVVNSSRALYLEISKVAQYAALERAGIPVPRTIAAVGRDKVLNAVRRLDQAPFILKPNRGGKGLGVQLFQSMDALAPFLDAPGEAAPIDGVWLVQEYVEPDRPFITRCEFIGGRFFYAVEVDASQGFELCPADVCAVDEAFCPAGEEASLAPGFSILDGFDHPILERYAGFLANNGIEVAGIEFIRRADGAIVTYDVNTNTNYNAQTEVLAGLYGMRELAAEQRRAA
jgi:RimK-like ATP-grasp domain